MNKEIRKHRSKKEKKKENEETEKKKENKETRKSTRLLPRIKPSPSLCPPLPARI